MARGPAFGRAWLFAVPLLLSLGVLLPGAGSEGTQSTDEQPWAMEIIQEGVIAQGVAWHAHFPTRECVVVSPSLLPVWTCSSVEVSSVNTDFSFTASDGVETIIVELDWDPAQPLAAGLVLDTYCMMPSNSSNPEFLPCFEWVRGHGPLQIRLDADHWTTRGYDPVMQWRVRVATGPSLGTHDSVGVDAGVAYQQTFTAYVSVFHHAPAPEGYTAIP